MFERNVIVRNGDVELAVIVKGLGPLVILMHGWPELGRSWSHQIDAISGAGYTVAAPDMRGYGGSSKPSSACVYNLDAAADDVAAVADALGYRRWISIGHDWGSMVAWRTALRFPERVVGVFSLSVPHQARLPMPMIDMIEAAQPNRFHYIRYFQSEGVAEHELEVDIRASLKRIYFSQSADAPLLDWLSERPREATLLAGLATPPEGQLSFMDDETLDSFAAAFEAGGFFGPVSWYRNFNEDFRQVSAYGKGFIPQPAGFLAGDKEVVLAMIPDALAEQRQLCGDLRHEIILPNTGHWIAMERPNEVSGVLVSFIDDVMSPFIENGGSGAL